MNHAPEPIQRSFFDSTQLCGVAYATGTPITIAKDRATRASNANWNIKVIFFSPKTAIY
jgi:hypothetical protein